MNANRSDDLSSFDDALLQGLCHDGAAEVAGARRAILPVQPPASSLFPVVKRLSPATSSGIPMALAFSVHDLLDYTAWQRQEWRSWFRREGSAALAVTTGPHGDGRIETIGALIRHIFSAELRYVERIKRLPLTDTSVVGTGESEPLFQFGETTRAQLVTLIETFPADDWDTPLEFTVVNSTVHVTPRKIVLQVLTHEMRHWAQVGTLLRLQGMKGDLQDLLFSPVLGGSIRKSR